MLLGVAHSLTKWLFSDIHDERQQLLCQYGLELWLYTIISTIGLITIGILFRATLETIIIVFVFYTCQSNGGGFHASTHLKCFLTMATGLIAGLLLLQWPGIQDVAYLLGFFSVCVLLLCPLCLHQNKSYLLSNRCHLIMRSRYITICLSTAFIIIYFWSKRLFSVGCIALFLSSISRMTAILRYHQLQ